MIEEISNEKNYKFRFNDMRLWLAIPSGLLSLILVGIVIYLMIQGRHDIWPHISRYWYIITPTIILGLAWIIHIDVTNESEGKESKSIEGTDKKRTFVAYKLAKTIIYFFGVIAIIIFALVTILFIIGGYENFGDKWALATDVEKIKRMCGIIIILLLFNIIQLGKKK